MNYCDAKSNFSAVIFQSLVSRALSEIVVVNDDLLLKKHFITFKVEKLCWLIFFYWYNFFRILWWT